MSSNPHTLGDRLRWAIDEHQPRRGRQRGLRLFQRRMEARWKGSTGVPYALSTIQTYLIPDPTKRLDPPLSFLHAAADVLGVREVWLTYGKGVPTEEEEKEAAAARMAGEPPPEDLRAGLERGLGAPLRGSVTIPLLHFWRRLRWAVNGDQLELPDDDEKLAERVGLALRGPLDAFGLTMERRDPDFVSEYVMACLPSLSVVLRALGLSGTEKFVFEKNVLTPEKEADDGD